MAIDLALRGVASVVLDDNDVVSIGSRAICWAKRTLEIFDRLGVGERMVEKGVTWKVGRLFHGDREVYNFDLLPEGGHKMPAFINLQQYYVEQFLVERARDFPELIDLRFKNRLAGVAKLADGAVVSVETPDGAYRLEADYLLACDGAKSPVRSALGLEFAGQLFEERFLIADIELKADLPSERWFWFEPSFHAGQSALLHKQPDNIYRIDLQLGWDADPEIEKRPENVIPRIERVLGRSDFEIDWVSVYAFQCRRLERFVHDRVIFVGDSAHVVSPFGARGGNGGIQDVDNLGWKLAAVLDGQAPQALARKLRRRTHPRRRREHRELGARHQFHDPEIGDGEDAARRGARSGRRHAVRAPAGQFGPAFGAVLAGRPAAADAVAGCAAAARLALQGCAAEAERPGRLAAQPARRRFRAAVARRRAPHRGRRHRPHPCRAAGRGRAAGRRRSRIRTLWRGF